MTNKSNLKRRSEFELFQNNEEGDQRKNREVMLATIGLIIISFCLLLIVWSHVFSIRDFV